MADTYQTLTLVLADGRRVTYMGRPQLTAGEAVRVVRELCESHERLRAELEGTAALLRDAEAEVLRLRNKMARMAVAFRLGMVVNNVKSDGLTAIAAELEKEGRADGTT